MYVIGDVHGHVEKLTGLLKGAGLVNEDLVWVGRDATLLFIGDLIDRGPDGIGVVDLVMRLQRDAAPLGGRVECLLGNHEVLILGAHRYGGNFGTQWLRNGGVGSDLSRLAPHHVGWMTNLPAMIRIGETLFVHADSTFYDRYGQSVSGVNGAITAVMRDGDPYAYDALLDRFSERHEFDGPNGAISAARFLRRYGARRLVHGHTPIVKVTGEPPESVTDAYTYAGGLCVNVDGGMYRGGPGFVYEVSVQSPSSL